MIKMKLQKIITVLFIYVFCISCIQSQETNGGHTEGIYPLLQTDLVELNLKGKVKSIRAVFNYNFNDTLTANQQLNFKLRNDILFTHISYADVNENGFFVKTAALIDSVNAPMLDTVLDHRVTIYHTLPDIEEKSQRRIDIQFLFPLLNPNPVQRNRKFFIPSEPDSSHNKYILEYIYKYNDYGYPVEEIQYSGLDENGDGILNDDEKKSLEETVTFVYDGQNRIVSKHYTFNREGIGNLRLGSTAFLEEFDFSIDRAAHYEYAYDDQDRIQEISFFIDNRLYKKDSFTYHDEGWVSQREMFIPGRSFYPGVRWRIIQEFNEHGDIIKARSYDRNEVLHNERFYEYVYDQQNNWVKCYIHLENEITDPPTAVGERIIEYYED